MAELTIAASGVRALFEVAVARGADRRALTERAGVDPAALDELDSRVPFSKYVALMRAGQELCHDPALALHFGEDVDTSAMSFTHQLGARSMTEGLAMINRYAPLTVEVDDNGTDRFMLTRRGGQLWMIDNRRNANEFLELTESSFARMVCSMRHATGDKQFVRAVHFTHAVPAYLDEYDRIFRVPLTFGSDKNAFLLDDDVINFKPPVASPYVSRVLTVHAEGLLEKLESSKSTRGRVERLLTNRLEGGDLRMESIASELCLSRQTLFRRLKSEGLTFERVLGDLRYRLALNYLSESRMSVNHAARLLGFADPSAFSRAFKRWTGSSPRCIASNHILVDAKERHG